MRKALLTIGLILVTLPAVAQSEWEIFRLTEYDREVIEGLREAQGLIQGRESVLQAYENTDQERIATARLRRLFGFGEKTMASIRDKITVDSSRELTQKPRITP